MVIETVKEKLCVNKLIASKKEILLVEGDMIVPDTKPDILNTICTSGVVCIYKKEVMDEKVRLDGNINTYIMYLADDSQDKVRGITTNLDFSEIIQVPNSKEGMNCKCEAKLKSIEAKVINGRKVGIKATLEVDIKIYSNEEIEIVNNIQNDGGIQMLKQDLKVNSLVGMGETKIYAKDTITVDNIDNIAEILKVCACICDKDIKVSYNKILTKAEFEIKIMYLTEDNRINSKTARIPVIGFIDIPNVTEENICDVNYEIKNIVIKLNSIEEHSIYVEAEIAVSTAVYEEKQINLIQDLYSPCENLDFKQKTVSTITNKASKQETKQIREKIRLDGIEGRNIIDVDVIPIIQKENALNSRVIYEGDLELKFVVGNNELDMDVKRVTIPFEYVLEPITDGENMNNELETQITNQDFIVQDGGDVSANIDILMNTSSHRSTNLNLIEEIQTNGEREKEDYGLIMYIVKKGDTLWEIAKKFGSTIDDIVRANGIENESLIYPDQKLYIPRYKRPEVSNVTQNIF